MERDVRQSELLQGLTWEYKHEEKGCRNGMVRKILKN